MNSKKNIYIVILLIGLLLIVKKLLKLSENFDFNAQRRNRGSRCALVYCESPAPDCKDDNRNKDLKDCCPCVETPEPEPAEEKINETKQEIDLNSPDLFAQINRRRRPSPNLVADGFLTFESQADVAIRTPALLRRVNVYD